MNKLKILSNYLKSAGLTEQSRLVIKLAQMENKDETLPEEEEEEESFYSYGRKLDDWMKELPSDSMVTVSPKPIEAIKDFSGSCTAAPKPRGVWYAPGSEWLDWMSGEMPDWLNDVNYIYKLTPNYSGGLDSSGGVLRLSTEEDILRFSEEFSISSYEIDWAKVASIWDGIEIIPYQHSLGYSIRWYYGWDIASGCIWRPSGASEFSLLRSRPGL